MAKSEDELYEMALRRHIRAFGRGLDESRLAVHHACALLRAVRFFKSVSAIDRSFGKPRLSLRVTAAHMNEAALCADLRTCRHVMHLCRQGQDVYRRMLDNYPQEKITRLKHDCDKALETDGYRCSGCETVFRVTMASGEYALEGVVDGIVSEMQSVCPKCGEVLAEGRIGADGEWRCAGH